MVKQKIPTTLGLRQLRQAKAEFEPFFYEYEQRGGTKTASRQLGVDEHQVIKTLVFEDQDTNPLVVLMHGDQQVSLKNLARQLGQKHLQPCLPARVHKLTGYQVGGVSPFGLLKNMPIYMEKSIMDLPWILINGGKRGFLVKISPSQVKQILTASLVEAAY